MTKTHKAVLSTLAVLCLLFMGSGVAQAQECIAQARNVGMVRAEGITEVVADIELRCAPATGSALAFDEIPQTLAIAVELNTPITNEINAKREVTVPLDPGGIMVGSTLGYAHPGIDLVARELAVTSKNLTEMVISDDNFQTAKLSDDGQTITWKGVPTGTADALLDPPVLLVADADDINLGEGEGGFSLIIKGIRANASTVGDDEDIVANVMLNGTPVNSSPIKVADVTTGLIVKVGAKTGLQCDDKDLMATITIQEGYKSGIMPGTSAAAAFTDEEAMDIDAVEQGDPKDRVIVVFSRIPEGVTVMVPEKVGLADNAPATDVNEVIESFELELDVDSRAGAVGKGVNGMYPVELSVAGAGAVVYNIFDDMRVATGNEWAKLPITFQWKAEGDMPAIGSSYVDVSFHPTSSEGGDTFETNGAAVPRFLETGDPIMVLKIDDCTTTLLFPFVTNMAMFDTGLVISNTSEESGSCTITYTGSNAPEDSQTTQAVAGGAQWISLSSTIAPGFQGYLTAACGFRDAHGFAYLSNGFGVGAATAAQGYLAVCTAGTSCGHPD